MRPGEMYGLIWENVNFTQRLLTIPRSKNGERRYPRLNSLAVAALLTIHGRGSGSGPVIRNAKGEPLCGPRYWFEKALASAKITGFHWHDLRHTFASRLVMNGVSLRAVQEALGHKSIAMTVRYSHLFPDFQFEAVDRLVPVAERLPLANSSGTTSGTSTFLPIEHQSVHVH
jgi:integrase